MYHNANNKFKSRCFKDGDYIKLITDYCNSNTLATGGNITEGFIHNLSEHRRLTKTWAHNKRLMDEKTVRDTKVEIAEFES